jgi:hypothetical protein
MSEEGTPRHRLLLVVRGLGWGAIGGGALGLLVVTFFMTILALATTASGEDIRELMTYLAIGGLVALQWGAGVGAAFGLAGGLALALSGRRAVQRMHRARLITGSAAAALPLVKAHYFSQAWGLHLGGYAGAAVLAVLGAFAAVLLTPLVVHGWPAPERRSERQRAGGHEPAGQGGGTDLRGTGTQEPPWLIVGRGVSWGVIGGAALGALCWLVVKLGSDGFASLAMIWLALGGAVLGAVLGFTGGLAVALNANEGEQSSAPLG